MVSILFGILAGILAKNVWLFLAVRGVYGLVKGGMNASRWIAMMGITPEDFQNPNTRKATHFAFFQGYAIAFVASAGAGSIARLFL